MNGQLAIEFRLFTQAQCELRNASQQNDQEGMRAALEELEAIGMHTTWGRLRARCDQIQREFTARQVAQRPKPLVIEITDETDCNDLAESLAELHHAAK